MSKSKLRKVHVNKREFGWTVAPSYPEGTELRIWDVESKQIIERIEVEAYTQITPSLIVTKIEKLMQDEKI
jgi:hypothetical protein